MGVFGQGLGGAATDISIYDVEIVSEAMNECSTRFKMSTNKSSYGRRTRRT